MPQYHEDQVLNYIYKTARGRNRCRARYDVKERIFLHNDTTTTTEIVDSSNDPMVRTLLRHIVGGNRSVFSLHFMNQHATLLSSPIQTSVLLLEPENDNNTLYLFEQMNSRGGEARIQFIQNVIRYQETFTMLEFAVWMQRSHIVCRLLQGGINPSVYSDVGQLVLQVFHAGVPLRLAGYFVQQVVQLRWNAVMYKRQHDLTTVVCPVCRQRECDLVYTHNDTDDDEPPHHCFCEVCWWKQNVLERLMDREYDQEVAPCLLCREESSSRIPTEYDPLSPAERAELSLQKFQNLSEKIPVPKIHETKWLVNTWAKAMRPYNRDVRVDRFFRSAERGHHQHIMGVLVSGMDVNATNEYGQTALFLAVWYGHERVVRVLMDFGSEPAIMSNGGASCFDIVSDSTVLRLLQENASSVRALAAGSLLREQRVEISCGHQEMNILLTREEPPGRGISCTIDNALSVEVLDKLMQVWGAIPTEKAVVKKKKGPCAARRYFCDSIGWVRLQLEAAIVHNLFPQACSPPRVVVYPHMRFLSYQEAGMELSPHIDLCRNHPFDHTLKSTHTLILYMTDCENGGGTTLLESVQGEELALASVQPKRGRIFIFPHDNPHRGEVVVDAPKILLRGEVHIPLAKE